MADQPKYRRGKGNKATPEKLARQVMGKQGVTNGSAKFSQLPAEQVMANANHVLQLAYLPEYDMLDPAAVRGRVQDFFMICAQNNKKPTVSSLALALGVDRRTLWTWVSGYTPRPPAVKAELQKAYAIINAEMEDYMLDGSINPVAGIFLMKNNHGYTDKTELEIRREDPLGDGQSREELDRKYRDSVVDVIDAIDVDVEPVE